MSSNKALDSPGPVPYEYQELDVSAEEIRLAELLPGEFDQEICLKIHSVAVPSRGVERAKPVFRIEELQKTLPQDWTVRETLRGRFIFERNRPYEPTEPYETSWTHPVAGIRPIANNYNYPHASFKYEALSHVWGSKAGSQAVYVVPSDATSADLREGLRHTLSVREDLAIALRHLRYKRSARMLWVDSICINQQNAVERGNQVQHMGFIYKSARRVIVWLGPERDGSQLAMSTLAHLGQQMEITDEGAWKVNTPGCPNPTWFWTSVALPYDALTWQTISKLLQRPWFQRVWVFQEVKLSSDQSIIQCGYDEIPLYTFCRAAWCASSKAGTLPPGLQPLLFDAAIETLPNFDEPFLNLLLHVGPRLCLDPRDKIYGALGLAPPSVARNIVVDYTKSVTEVYKDACLALLKATNRVDFLLSCDYGTRQIPGPSWIPDFSSSQGFRARRFPWLVGITQASGVSEATAEVTHHPSSLLVKGVQCGVISRVGRKAPDEFGGDDGLRSAVKDWASLFSMHTKYVTGEPMLDAFVKTVHWSILRERCPEDLGLHTLPDARIMIQRALGRPTETDGEFNDNADKPPPELELPEALGRSFITTANGYMGMTSYSAQVNDIVCVALGCPLPLILRPHGPGAYVVVGTAYIHGLMDAESLLGPLDHRWALKANAESGRYGASHFVNQATGTVVDEDPRLGSLPCDWVRLEAVRTPTDPQQFVRFRHLATGKTMNGDPRLLPEALIANGVQVQIFRLV